ncbi:MAG: hypothetical protein CME68_09515 [Halobacteriovoraceae bacterium]|nr:hypothetical protein [Halobacteriovoraceae bacterium]|tara:strand:+ start:88 stop:906 length:819 start_codon:yes stop_codon:yes gene_type:complete
METISLNEKRVFTKKPTSIPKNWWEENRFFNHFFNSLSLILPVGELFFIKSMKLHQKSIKCEKLRNNVELFIFQETKHFSEHDLWFNRNLKESGYPIDRMIYPFKVFMKLGNSRLSPGFALALTVACEHLTTILARLVLRDNGWLEGASFDYKKIWHYHALEELEHKCVAFDLYKEVGGSHWLRVFSLIQAFIVFSFFIFQLMVCFLWLDRSSLFSLKALREFFLFSRLLIKSVTPFFGSYSAFFASSFHPSDEDDSELVRVYREKVKTFCH